MANPFNLPTISFDDETELPAEEQQSPSIKQDKKKQTTINSLKSGILELLRLNTPALYVLVNSLRLNALLLDDISWLLECQDTLKDTYGDFEHAQLDDALSNLESIKSKQQDYIQKITKRRNDIQNTLDKLNEFNNKFNNATKELLEVIPAEPPAEQPAYNLDDFVLLRPPLPKQNKADLSDEKPLGNINTPTTENNTKNSALANEIDNDLLDGVENLKHVEGRFSGRNHVVFDFEVFSKYWLVVCLILEDKKLYHFDNSDDLRQFFNGHKNDVWVGYNNKNYDNFILKFALAGCNCTTLKELNDYIINGGSGYKFQRMAEEQDPTFYRRRRPYDDHLISFDLIKVMGKKKLKKLEAFTGRDIVESSISFDYDGEFTSEQKKETLDYCINDVLFTAHVLIKKWGAMTATEQLVNIYNLPLTDLIQTDATLSAKILQAKYIKRNDDYALNFPTYANCLECQQLKEWYSDPANHNPNASIILDIQGIKCKYGFGGLHGARPNYFSDGEFYHIDVTSYYPSMMIQYNLLSRNVTKPELFKKIVEDRILAKSRKDKLTADALKIVINATNGAANSDYYNPLKDVRQYFEVAIFGQLLITQLAIMLKDHCRLIQINTDALDIQITDTPINEIMEIVKSWETNTGLHMEKEHYIKLAQKAVNDYLRVDSNGNMVGKGKAVKNFDRDGFDNELSIVNEAVKKAIMFNTPIADTVNNCNELICFQRIVTASSGHDTILHGGQPLKQSVNRIFASSRPTDGGIMQKSATTSALHRITDTPSNVFIINTDIRGASTPAYLNKQWYIDHATKLYNQYQGTKNKTTSEEEH